MVRHYCRKYLLKRIPISPAGSVIFAFLLTERRVKSCGGLREGMISVFFGYFFCPAFDSGSVSPVNLHDCCFGAQSFAIRPPIPIRAERCMQLTCYACTGTPHRVCVFRSIRCSGSSGCNAVPRRICPDSDSANTVLMLWQRFLHGLSRHEECSGFRYVFFCR